jgi:hypothetical protein
LVDWVYSGKRLKATRLRPRGYDAASKDKGFVFYFLFTADPLRTERNFYLATDPHGLTQTFFLDIPSKKIILVRVFPCGSVAI